MLKFAKLAFGLYRTFPNSKCRKGVLINVNYVKHIKVSIFQVYVRDPGTVQQQKKFNDKLKNLQTWTSEVHIFLSNPVECTFPDLPRYQEQLLVSGI